MLCRNELLTGDNQKCFTLSHLHAHTSLHLSTINLAHLYNLSSHRAQSLFHATSLQKTHQSALQVQQKAEVLLQAGHYDADAIRECAEKVALHWQQLMLKMEDRLKLVNASVAFYKTSEQVSSAIAYSLGPFCQLIRASVVLRYPQPTNTNVSAFPHGSGGGGGFSTLTPSAEGLLLTVDLTALAK